MRGDGVGVGDIGEVQCFSGRGWFPQSCVDGAFEGDIAHGSLFDGFSGAKRSGWFQCCCCWRGIFGDGAWLEHGKDGSHGEAAGGAHGMRGDGMDVGLGDAMQDFAGYREIAASCGDSWHAVREFDRGLVRGCCTHELDDRGKHRRHRWGVRHDARKKLWGRLHTERTDGSYRMRGDGVEVGLGGHMQTSARGTRISTRRPDSWRPIRKCHRGVDCE